MDGCHNSAVPLSRTFVVQCMKEKVEVDPEQETANHSKHQVFIPPSTDFPLEASREEVPVTTILVCKQEGEEKKKGEEESKSR